MIALRRKMLRMSKAGAAIFACAIIAACVLPGGEAQSADVKKTVAAPVSLPAPVTIVAQAAPTAPASKPAAPGDLYGTEPIPLTPVQCGQCHTSIFRFLKQDGGKHKFECQNCHQEFHSYSPVKGNWAALMPKCASCHTLPHGPKQTECLSCHANPHTPRKVVMTEKLASGCADCHSSPAAQLKQYPSKHTLQPCQACHTSHGLIPSCANCHQPHYKEQAMATCTGCHPVHQPLQIAFKSDTDLKTCSGCHDKVYGSWSKSPSKHGKVSCVTCHTKHGMIPKCVDCHGRPHSEALLEKFRDCLTCHLDPHDPPVKKK